MSTEQTKTNEQLIQERFELEQEVNKLQVASAERKF
jgi:cell division protein FtsB